MTIEVDLPDGSVAEFPDGTPPDVMKSAIQKRFPTTPQKYDQAASQGKSFGEAWMQNYAAPKMQETDAAKAAQSDLGKQYQQRGFFPQLDAATEGSAAGLMGGWDDELMAAAQHPMDALKSAADWWKGQPSAPNNAYVASQAAGDQRKAERRAAFPGTSLASETAGGLALGGTLQPGISAATSSLPPALAATLEGGGYGALYGAGEAKPGERMLGAATGAAVGGLTGIAAQQMGQVFAGRQARAAQADAPTSGDLKAASGDQFAASEMSGVEFQPDAVDKLRTRMKMAAGEKISARRQPVTQDFLSELDDTFSGPMSLEDFESFRQDLGAAWKNAEPGSKEARSLQSMKRIMDEMTDNPPPDAFSGGKEGIDALGKARSLWAQAKKTEIVEKIMDKADVKSGRYTQSGLANTIREQMSTLYGKIVDGRVKGFSAEETALIRQMAKGQSSNAAINLLARFAPRGPVSIALGQLVGSQIPGGQFAVPLAGQAAGVARDMAAAKSAEALRNAVATGQAPIIPSMLPNKALPFIGGGVAGIEGLLQQLLPSQPSPSPRSLPAR
jgi:hypothetical protein